MREGRKLRHRRSCWHCNGAGCVMCDNKGSYDTVGEPYKIKAKIAVRDLDDLFEMMYSDLKRLGLTPPESLVPKEHMGHRDLWHIALDKLEGKPPFWEKR